MADGEDDATVTLDDSKESNSDIFQGRLKKQGSISTKWYHCIATLEKDCFVYKRDDKPKSKLVFLLDVKLEHEEQNECIFTLIDLKKKKKKNKKLVFKTSTKEECDQWMESIFEAILECKQNTQDQDKSEACSLQ